MNIVDIKNLIEQAFKDNLIKYKYQLTAYREAKISLLTEKLLICIIESRSKAKREIRTGVELSDRLTPDAIERLR